MIYSSQMGIKTSICEFLKDLVPNEGNPDTSGRKVSLQQVLLDEVVSRFIYFFDNESQESKEEYKETQVVVKALDSSKCFITQFLTKLVQEGQQPLITRIYFVQNRVFQKVTNLTRDQSVHLNVEIVKFLKALVVQKERSSLMLMIQKDSCLEVCKMFLTNKNKGNLLSSTILSLFESISQLMPPDFLKKLMKRFV